MRLIDIEAPCKVEIELDGEKCHATVTAPTVDVVPVKHGEWIDPTTGEFCYRCSVCEEYTHMEIPRLLYHFCPNCGAKMDGGKDNE